MIHEKLYPVGIGEPGTQDRTLESAGHAMIEPGVGSLSTLVDAVGMPWASLWVPATPAVSCAYWQLLSSTGLCRPV